MKSAARRRGEKRTHREKQRGEVGEEVAPEFQGLGSKRQDKWPEAIKLKQIVLPTVGDRHRKLKDRHSAVPRKARKLCPGKKKIPTNTRGQLAFYSLKKREIKVNRNQGDITLSVDGKLMAYATRETGACFLRHLNWSHSHQ